MNGCFFVVFFKYLGGSMKQGLVFENFHWGGLPYHPPVIGDMPAAYPFLIYYLQNSKSCPRPKQILDPPPNDVPTMTLRRGHFIYLICKWGPPVSAPSSLILHSLLWTLTISWCNSIECKYSIATERIVLVFF